MQINNKQSVHTTECGGEKVRSTITGEHKVLLKPLFFILLCQFLSLFKTVTTQIQPLLQSKKKSFNSQVIEHHNKLQFKHQPLKIY